MYYGDKITLNQRRSPLPTKFLTAPAELNLVAQLLQVGDQPAGLPAWR